MKKLFYTYERIHQLINKIALDIKKDNWDPDCIIAISAGGLIPARILRNYINKDIYIVGVKRYFNDAITHDVMIKVQWIDDIEKKIHGKKVLLIDEIDDTRITLAYCLKELLRSEPMEIRVAVIHEKIKQKGDIFPKEILKSYVGEVIEDLWVNYPWESLDIDEHYKNCMEEKQ